VPELGGIRHFVPVPTEILPQEEAFNRKAVLRTQNPEEQLRGKLVEAVPTLVVRWSHKQQVTAQLDHFHRVRDCLREVEHMLKGAAVNHSTEALFQ
jgi:hypothetical protein